VSLVRPVTTGEVLRARGAKTRKTLRLDRRAGLFDGLEPVRTSTGRSSRWGVFLLWPPAALRRARAIRRLQAQGLYRRAIRERLEG